MAVALRMLSEPCPDFFQNGPLPLIGAHSSSAGLRPGPDPRRGIMATGPVYRANRPNNMATSTKPATWRFSLPTWSRPHMAQTRPQRMSA